MKRILSYILSAIMCAALALVCVWSFAKGLEADESVVCKRIAVTVKDSKHKNFVSEDRIRQDIVRRFGDLNGQPLNEIDICAIESFVDSRSAILKSEVYTTRDSTLNIDIRQRHPVLRFISNGRGCYCDNQGKLFPLQGKSSARVLTVDGALPIDPSVYGRPQNEDVATWLIKMVSFAEFIADNGWQERISSVRVTGGKDLTLYMIDCDEAILFGTPDDVEAKFKRITKWYTSVRPNTEDKHYKTVNIKFDGQLVCR